MTIQICRNLISFSLKNPNPLGLRKPHHQFSAIFSLLFSSSSSSSPNQSISLSDYLFHHHQFSPETLPNSFTGKFLKTPEKYDSILSFLKESGFSKTHLETVIKHAPRVLYANLDQTIKPKIKIFQDLGFSPTDIADIVSADPWILSRGADRLGPSILVLKSVLGSNAGVSRVLKICGWFLKCDLEKTMLPNVEFLKSCGVSSSQIVKYIYNFPRLFLHKPESIKKFVERVDELGMDRKSKGFLNAIRTISSMTVENWELKLELFRSLGFSEDDIVSVFRKAPQVFAVSERKIKESTRVLCGFGESDISLIVCHPDLLNLSVENRLKPRLRVVEILESKNLLRKKPSLTTVCKMSHKRFFEKFVLPHSNEVGKFLLPYLQNE
ncbi:hypothetical protein Acr_21g0006390 [Actinidia rufa]|uniref:Mitochondrial transcription termination factor family protein n=1 Tax=Actinidia rufa TaxID=165716 RepID=A0A7J0GGU5_9ERIC|nr:hypothetical protein Acr_21g0006390 [Actinidia rufa]